MDDLTLERRLEAKDKLIAELVEALEEWRKRPSDRWQDAIDTDDGYTLTPLNILENKTRNLIRIHKGE